MWNVRACLVGLAVLALSHTVALAQGNGTGGGVGAEMPSDASPPPQPNQSDQATPAPQSDDTGATTDKSTDGQEQTPAAPPADPQK
jgi:hypothetical protein